MGFGFAKGFIIALLIGLFFAIGMKSYVPFLWIIGTFIIIKIVWNVLTK